MRLALELLAGVHIYMALLAIIVLPFMAPELLALAFPKRRRRRPRRIRAPAMLPAIGTGLGGPLGGIVGGALGQLFTPLGGPRQ